MAVLIQTKTGKVFIFFPKRAEILTNKATYILDCHLASEASAVYFNFWREKLGFGVFSPTHNLIGDREVTMSPVPANCKNSLFSTISDSPRSGYDIQQRIRSTGKSNPVNIDVVSDVIGDATDPR